MNLAVISASGIGDALILHPLSHAAHLKGWNATTFSNHLASFGPWLPPGSSVALQPSLEENFSGYDACFLQHDNSPKAFRIKTLKIPVYTFYGSYIPSKHGPFNEGYDFIADRNQSMVANIEAASWKFFKIKPQIGFTPPPGLIHRRFPKRIAIHPTASTDEKIWPRDKFMAIAAWLKNEGYDPVFTVAPLETVEWNSPLFPTLGDLASFLYESGAFLGNDSGTAHLASLLRIPHLVIAGNGLQMPLWRTGWFPGRLIAPPLWLMQLKGLRKYWKQITTKNIVIKNLKESILRN